MKQNTLKIVIALVLFMPIFVAAQNKMLTVEEAVLKQRNTLAPARLQGLAWVGKTNKFAYIAKQNGADCVVMQDAVSLKTDTVLTAAQYHELIAKAVAGQTKSDRIGNIQWVDSVTFKFTVKQSIYQANIKNGSVDVVCYLPADAEHVEVDETTQKVAFVLNHNIYVVNKQTEIKKEGDNIRVAESNRITTDGTEDLVYGQSVHRNEFGISKGLFWSPKGNRLAYYQMNQSMVTPYSIYQLDTKPASNKQIRYPMAGATSHVVNLYVRDFTKNRTVKIQTTGPSDQYLTNISWHPAEEKIYIMVVNREQTEMKLNEYDAVTGVFIKTLLTETHAKYVEPEEPIIFCNNPSEFLMFSKRSGYNHLYVYNANGRLEKQLTTGNFDVTQFLGFNQNGKYAYYTAASNDGLDRYTYKVELKTGKSTKLTLMPGTHATMLSHNGNFLLDVFSNLKTPRKTFLITENGEERALLLNATNPIADYKPCEITLQQIKAADGVTTLNGRLILPADFNPTKKYPTLVYLYGGPHAQMVTNSWLGGADLWLYYMAQNGYVVFTVDNRGSSNRGLDFENVTHRKLGVEEKADQLKGIDFLKGLNYVDTSRMGIYGWSFGGFMTTTMMTKTNVFKAGVAGGPVIDWSLYEIMYTERYMDTPKENPEGYAENNLLNSVKNLKGNLMLIHGTDDDVVLWQHSLQYLKKCVDNGVQLDYFVYPGHLHNVTGKDRVHLMQKITNYFNKNL